MEKSIKFFSLILTLVFLFEVLPILSFASYDPVEEDPELERVA